jgi:hypothetical protein
MILSQWPLAKPRNKNRHAAMPKTPIVFERPYTGTDSNPLLISPETVSFHWTCR